MFLIISLLYFSSVALFAFFGVPLLINTYVELNKTRAKRFAIAMDRTMLQDDIKRVAPFYFFGPLMGAAVGFFLLPAEFKIFGVIGGILLGLSVPKFYADSLITKRRREFGNQLIDALMIMSSSFRGGLSLIQSMEAVAEEMPDPIRMEFSIVLGENKMGVTMDEAMNRLYKRMTSPAMQQMISAILLARETGGNLPVIFTRIVQTIRERKKIEENINVLTVQGKIQALVMSGLPVGFFMLVNSTNPTYFKTMTGSDTGRMLLIICAFLWVVGTLLILKISSFKDI